MAPWPAPTSSTRAEGGRSASAWTMRSARSQAMKDSGGASIGALLVRFQMRRSVVALKGALRLSGRR